MDYSWSSSFEVFDVVFSIIKTKTLKTEKCDKKVKVYGKRFKRARP